MLKMFYWSFKKIKHKYKDLVYFCVSNFKLVFLETLLFSELFSMIGMTTQNVFNIIGWTVLVLQNNIFYSMLSHFSEPEPEVYKFWRSTKCQY